MPSCTSMTRVYQRACGYTYDVTTNAPIPAVPCRGARIKVLYAGACYNHATSGEMKSVHIDGITDTSLYPGSEISGIVECLGSDVISTTIQVGDRVIIYPGENTIKQGYCELLIVDDIHSLIPVPGGMSMELAATLPTGGLWAYNTVTTIQTLLKQKYTETNAVITIMIAGAGSLGLWTLNIARMLLVKEPHETKIVIADSDCNKLKVAQHLGCDGVIHWDNTIYEEHLIDRTRNTCNHGVDIAVDYSNTSRATKRIIAVLNENGSLLVGGTAHHDITLSPFHLARNRHHILGIPLGTKQQLYSLIQLVAEHQLATPTVHTYSLDRINEMYKDLREAKVIGRAVIQMSPDANGN